MSKFILINARNEGQVFNSCFCNLVIIFQLNKNDRSSFILRIVQKDGSLVTLIMLVLECGFLHI